MNVQYLGRAPVLYTSWSVIGAATRRQYNKRRYANSLLLLVGLLLCLLHSGDNFNDNAKRRGENRTLAARILRLPS